MISELDVLRIVSERLDAAQVPYMLTGSYALAEYRQVEFARRREINFSGVKTWIATREDLILSKLVWAKDSGSELQQRDVRSLMDDSVDRGYVGQWAKRLGVDALLRKVADE